MGAEVLAKRARRDIRRAFAPEASEEVLKFVAGVRDEIALTVATQHNVNLTLGEVDRVLKDRLRDVEAFALVARAANFRQRLRWLLTGRFLR